MRSLSCIIYRVKHLLLIRDGKADIINGWLTHLYGFSGPDYNQGLSLAIV